MIILTKLNDIMKNIFKFLSILLLFVVVGCSNNGNDFPPSPRAFYLRILESDGSDLAKSDALWEDELWVDNISTGLYKSIKIVNYINGEVYSTTSQGGNNEIISKVPLLQDSQVQIIGVEAYVVTDSEQVACDESVMTIVSEPIFGDTESHVVKIMWDNSESNSTRLPSVASVTIDGSVVDIETTSDYPYSIIPYVRK